MALALANHTHTHTHSLSHCSNLLGNLCAGLTAASSAFLFSHFLISLMLGSHCNSVHFNSRRHHQRTWSHAVLPSISRPLSLWRERKSKQFPFILHSSLFLFLSSQVGYVISGIHRLLQLRTCRSAELEVNGADGKRNGKEEKEKKESLSDRFCRPRPPLCLLARTVVHFALFLLPAFWSARLLLRLPTH